MKLNFLYSLLIMAFFSACQSAEQADDISIHPLPDLSYVSESESFSGEKYSIKNEYFVISGISYNKQKLKQAVSTYNAATLSAADLKKHYAHKRFFYRETDATPRNYTEKNKGYFEHDRIDFHSDDLVVLVQWTAFGDTEEYIFQ